MLEAEIAGGRLGLAGGVPSFRRRCVSARDFSEFVDHWSASESTADPSFGVITDGGRGAVALPCRVQV